MRRRRGFTSGDWTRGRERRRQRRGESVRKNGKRGKELKKQKKEIEPMRR